MGHRAIARFSLGVAALLLAAATGASFAPEIRNVSRDDARFRLSIMVETVIPTARGAADRLDTCRVRARVTRLIHARAFSSLLARSLPAERPRAGSVLHTRVRCWAYDNRVFEPLDGQRIYYGGPERYIHLEVWGSFVGGRFVVFDFVQRDGA